MSAAQAVRNRRRAPGPARAGTPRGTVLLLAALALGAVLRPDVALAAGTPILVYHRFGASVADSMTVTTRSFESQLQAIESGGYRVIPLRQLVEHMVANGPPLPARAVVITADDGHRSVYTEMLPVVRRHAVPVTLFVYPSAISNADYALRWEELAELRATGLFDVQSHTYWHPNFFRERRHLDAEAWNRLVDTQLLRSKQVLEQRLGGRVDLLAWTFGQWDAELAAHARRAGYIAAFTLERRPAREGDELMALPRYLVTDALSPAAFDAILREAAGNTAGSEARR